MHLHSDVLRLSDVRQALRDTGLSARGVYLDWERDAGRARVSQARAPHRLLSVLLHDATEGDAQLAVRLGKGESAELHASGVVLSTIIANMRKGRTTSP